MPLTKLINQHISKDPITFEHFMRLALYEPNLGYYNNDKPIFGKEGDYTTAPEISPLFSKCLANQCIEILDKLNDPTIFEFGAGSGIMAANIMLHLAHENSLPTKYQILEVSPYLRELQQQTIDERCHI